MDFRSEFNKAKKEGKKEFVYGNKKYSTKTAEEIARKQTPAQNLLAARKAEIVAQEKGFKNKGLNKVADSYSKVYGEQKMKEQGVKNPPKKLFPSNKSW